MHQLQPLPAEVKLPRDCTKADEEQGKLGNRANVALLSRSAINTRPFRDVTNESRRKPEGTSTFAIETRNCNTMRKNGVRGSQTGGGNAESKREGNFRSLWGQLQQPPAVH
ncbi:hypothetical protein BaRGS_00039469 [Batillaria attramentaria]|uniref:Uncharacterized protein n=1 Tax=Batillaria attramentaria TaxID=370345 RepID=A0ABD0J314_9CAEN